MKSEGSAFARDEANAVHTRYARRSNRLRLFETVLHDRPLNMFLTGFFRI